LLINYLKTNNPRIYNKDLVLNNSDDFTIAKWDAIFNVGTSTSREHMILAQFTALKLNLAITQLDGTGGLVQKNDDICSWCSRRLGHLWRRELLRHVDAHCWADRQPCRDPLDGQSNDQPQ
jgi:hypothetical protein